MTRDIGNENSPLLSSIRKTVRSNHHLIYGLGVIEAAIGVVGIAWTLWLFTTWPVLMAAHNAYGDSILYAFAGAAFGLLFLFGIGLVFARRFIQGVRR